MNIQAYNKLWGAVIGLALAVAAVALAVPDETLAALEPHLLEFGGAALAVLGAVWAAPANK